ncbi:MAG: hypothetical protein ACFFD4_27385, partial [Candidatus Odinarchaeota archaeon]
NELGAAGFNIRGTLAASAVEKSNAIESFTFIFKESIDYLKSRGKAVHTEKKTFNFENFEE